MLHETVPAAENCPGGHVGHEGVPGTFEYDPAGHNLHVEEEVAPTVSEYFPTGQGVAGCP